MTEHAFGAIYCMLLKSGLNYQNQYKDFRALNISKLLVKPFAFLCPVLFSSHLSLNFTGVCTAHENGHTSGPTLRDLHQLRGFRELCVSMYSTSCESIYSTVNSKCTCLVVKSSLMTLNQESQEDWILQ